MAGQQKKEASLEGLLSDFFSDNTGITWSHFRWIHRDRGEFLSLSLSLYYYDRIIYGGDFCDCQARSACSLPSGLKDQRCLIIPSSWTSVVGPFIFFVCPVCVVNCIIQLGSRRGRTERGRRCVANRVDLRSLCIIQM